MEAKKRQQRRNSFVALDVHALDSDAALPPSVPVATPARESSSIPFSVLPSPPDYSMEETLSNVDAVDAFANQSELLKLGSLLGGSHPALGRDFDIYRGTHRT